VTPPERASDQAAYVTGAVIPMDGGGNPII